MSSESRTGPRWILASSSPRRREILRRLGFDFEVRPPDADESVLPGEAPEALAERLARVKAEAIASELETPAFVIGSDTVVALGEDVLGKPEDAAEAASMLRRLSGQTHRVISGLCVIGVPDGPIRSGAATTEVVMRTWSDDEVAAYVASGECFGKAGAYAIQESADRFVTALRGSYDNVVGLPSELLEEMCRDLGLTWPMDLSEES